ncbi:MAG TPA: hypothetical protein VKP89_11375 [Burkholderiales bacterium]|nr:hypothetical protein [Burkholderiales bacterium]
MSAIDALFDIERSCAEQYYAFDARAWLQRAAEEGARVAAVAEYLSGTSWFGHEEDLAAVAAAIRGGAGRPAQTGNLSLVGLSSRTRYLVAQRKEK